MMEYNDTRDRIDKLEKIIIALDTAFDVGNDCVDPFTGEIILDNEYDVLKKELFEICPESKIFSTVTASKSEMNGEKIIHDPPMTSINKVNGTEQEKKDILNKWFKSCVNNFKEELVEDGKTFCMSYKIDGLALSINYKNGILVEAGMRSKSGQDGINVTDKTRYIAGIPQKLPLPFTLTVRGEVETSISEFKKQCEILGDDAKSNPRAHSSGSMNQKTAEKMKDRGLSFIAYNILNLDNPPYKTEIERAIWAEKNLGINFVKTIPFKYDMLKTFEENHRRLNFLVDGCVISVNNLQDQLYLGTHGNSFNSNPKGKIAFKFADEVKDVVITGIEWQTGRTGQLTPVLNFPGINLEGTIVQKCTAHNWGVIKSNKISIGSKISIIKSGKIIPKIHKVIEANGTVEFPEFCPSCSRPTKEIEGGNNALSVICDNPNCPAQNIQGLEHYLKRIGVKGIAESTISKLCEYRLVSEPSDFYKLTLDRLISIGIKERSAILILARIKMINAPEQEKDNSLLLHFLDKIKDKKIPVKMETFISALGIDTAGREFGRIMTENYGNFNEVRNLSKSQLETIDGIGPITANNVYNYFKDFSQQIDNLLEFIEIKIPEKKSGKLKDKTICLSGSFEGGKIKWNALIESQGGKVSSSVSKKTDYLLAGEGSGSKSEKALKLGIPIITTEELEKILS